MPSIVTHNEFSKDVFKKLNRNEQNLIKDALNHYYIFAQSFDNLFYYRFFLGPLGTPIQKKGDLFHKTFINEYFINIIEYIKDNQLTNNAEVMSYLFGSFCHYALDHTCHPYVIYKTGNYRKGEKNNLKYRGLHNKMEVEIDVYIYETKHHKAFYKQKLANDLLPKVKFNQGLNETIKHTYQKTFNQENMDKIYLSSVKTGNHILKYFVTDRTGIKKSIYKFGDAILKNNERKYQYLSTFIKDKNENNLNLNNTAWYYPSDKNIKRNHSFLELYDMALETCVSYINASLNYLNNNISLNELKSIIKDYSYDTGLTWHDKRTLQYFEF